jgi:hypothetical protein
MVFSWFSRVYLYDPVMTASHFLLSNLVSEPAARLTLVFVMFFIGSVFSFRLLLLISFAGATHRRAADWVTYVGATHPSLLQRKKIRETLQKLSKKV